ncbi:MAG: synthase, gamma subunit [Acidimicrobiaceae bacterium]|nr:synthase, gamma subunit [Acidimicrobiaceae bacterium]
MAGGQERELRRRIRSVSATKKITRAMELIAASEMTRAQGRIAGSRPYVEGIKKVLAAVAAEAVGAQRFLGEPEQAERVLLVAIVSDRGLAGGYNNSVLRSALRRMRAGEQEGRSYRLVTVGRRAISFFRFNGVPVDDAFIKMTDRPRFEDARTVAQSIVGPFLAGDVDLVELVSTHFVSAGTQVVETQQLLPLVPEEAPSGADRASGEEPAPGTGHLYEFEPDPEELLQLLVPQYAEAVLYAALLEASASEHTARQRAMSAATENADELITTYRRAMNRARQDSITTEIMEIVGGAEALRHAGGSERGHIDLDQPLNEERIA